MATPRIEPLGCAASPEKVDPFIPRAVSLEVVNRFVAVIEGMVNHGGAALTYILRFLILFPVAASLVFVELLVRFDDVVTRQSRKLPGGAQ